MVVFVSAVNWQISAAVTKTRPSAISLKWRSSRPLAANPNITSPATIRTSAATSTATLSSAPHVWAIAVLGCLHRDHARLGLLGREPALLREHAHERVAHVVAHVLGPAHVDVGAGLHGLPHQRPLLD